MPIFTDIKYLRYQLAVEENRNNGLFRKLQRITRSWSLSGTWCKRTYTMGKSFKIILSWGHTTTNIKVPEDYRELARLYRLVIKGDRVPPIMTERESAFQRARI
ncbi:MAG: hypothetical protein U5L96_11520 [Owenweeksia sp.]|nr:hypothetical protein [Owenweeksia sp.]